MVQHRSQICAREQSPLAGVAVKPAVGIETLDIGWLGEYVLLYFSRWGRNICLVNDVAGDSKVGLRDSECLLKPTLHLTKYSLMVTLFLA